VVAGREDGYEEGVWGGREDGVEFGWVGWVSWVGHV